jgi:phosphocarrier protein HPr
MIARAKKPGKEIEAQAVVTVKNPHGLHARPASMLIKTISAFDCEVLVEQGDCKANAKSIFGLLSLAAGYDTKLTFTAQGKRRSSGNKGDPKAL